MAIYFSKSDNKFYNSNFGSYTGSNFVEMQTNDYITALSSNQKLKYNNTLNRFYTTKTSNKSEKIDIFRSSLISLSKTMINYAGYRGLGELNSLYVEGATSQQNLEIKDLLDWRTNLLQKTEEVITNYKNNTISSLPTLSYFLYDNDLYLSNYTNTFTRDSIIFLPAVPEQEFPGGISGCTGGTGSRDENLRTNRANQTPELSINRNEITQTIRVPEFEIPDGYEAGASLYANLIYRGLESSNPQITNIFSLDKALLNSITDPRTYDDSETQGFIYSPAIDVYPSSELQVLSGEKKLTDQQVNDWIEADQKLIIIPPGHVLIVEETEPHWEAPDGTPDWQGHPRWVISPPNESRSITGGLSAGGSPIKTDRQGALSFECLTGDSLKEKFHEYSEVAKHGCRGSSAWAEDLCKSIGGCFTFPEGTTGNDIYFPGNTTNDHFFGFTGQEALDHCVCAACSLSEFVRPKRSPFDFLPHEGSALEHWDDFGIDGVSGAEDLRRKIIDSFNCCPIKDENDVAEDAGLTNTELWYPQNYCGIWKYTACCDDKTDTKIDMDFKYRIPLPGIGWACDDFTWDENIFDFLPKDFPLSPSRTQGPKNWCMNLYNTVDDGAYQSDSEHPGSPCMEDQCIKHPYQRIERGFDNPDLPEEIKTKRKVVYSMRFKIKLRLIRAIWNYIKNCGINYITDLLDEDSCEIKTIKTILRGKDIFWDNNYLDLIITIAIEGECRFTGTTYYTGNCGCEPFCPCDHPGCSGATGKDGGPCVDERLPEYLPPPSLTAQPLSRDERQ